MLADRPNNPESSCAYCRVFSVGTPAAEELVCGCETDCGAARCDSHAGQQSTRVTTTSTETPTEVEGYDPYGPQLPDTEQDRVRRWNPHPAAVRHDTAASVDIYELLAPALSLADRALADDHTDDGPRFWDADADAEQPATHVFGKHTAQIVDERAGGAVAYAHDNNAAWIVAALNAATGAFPSWPEVAEPYADGTEPIERYVVTLVVGYDPRTTGGNVTDPKRAALAALNLTRDDQCHSTVWHVYDRDTARLHRFDQSEFADGEFDTDHIDTHEE